MAAEKSQSKSCSNASKTAEECNDFARSRVPRDKRRSTLNVSMVLIGFCISMAGLYVGAEMAGGMDVKSAIVAALLGNAVLVVYAGLVGAMGAREGVGTSMLTRHAFGRIGSQIISVIFALTMAGWYAYQCGFFGNCINAMFPGGGFLTNHIVAGIWGGLLMIATTFVGYKGLSIVSNISAPLIFLTSGMGLFAAIGAIGGWDVMMELKPAADIPITAGVVMTVGAFGVGGVIQADVTRYSKSAKGSLIATAIGYLFAHSFVIIAGCMMCSVSGTGDLPQAMLAMGLGLPALIVLICAQWTTNNNNLYSSSLAMSNVLPFQKNKIVVVIGIIATLLGACGLSNYFVNWLTILGVTIPPVAGILICDYYVLKKRSYPFGEGTVYQNISVPAFLAWIIASALGFAITWGVQCINSLAASFAVYYLLSLLFDKCNLGVTGGYSVELADGNTKNCEPEQGIQNG